jgi:FkbM family methyltransferase
MKNLIYWLKGNLQKYCPALAASLHAYRLVREMRRYPLKVTPYGFKVMGNKAMQDGTFEPEETRLIRQVLGKASVFIDVGANIGFYSCLARSLEKYAIAVEPCQQNLEFLYTNLKANGWNDMEVHPVGLAAQLGLVSLYGAGTGASVIRTWAQSFGVLEQIIPTSTLDILLGDRFAGEQLLIKVDVEGVEFEVLQGAVKTLRRTPSPIWIMEICLTEHFPEGINPHFEAVFQRFWENGYEARTVGQDNRLVTPEAVKEWVKNRSRGFGHINYLFEKTPQERSST